MAKAAAPARHRAQIRRLAGPDWAPDIVTSALLLLQMRARGTRIQRHFRHAPGRVEASRNVTPFGVAMGVGKGLRTDAPLLSISQRKSIALSS